MLVFILLLLFVLLVGTSIIRGAPFLPTHKAQLEIALDMLDLKPGDHIVDVGSGDGRMLIQAAKRGIRATGYEINPLVYALSKLRIRKYRELVDVKLADMWQKGLPKDTDAVFVFTMGWYLPRLIKKLHGEGFTHMKIVSHAYELEGVKPKKQQGAMFLYEI